MIKEEIIKLAIEHTISGLKFDEDGLLRFAKLIVNECADIADIAEPYNASDLIKKHFGVEE